MEWVHQVILNMIAMKDLYKNIFDHIYLWGENLASIAWAIRYYYNCTIMATPGQSVFGRDMIFKRVAVIGAISQYFDIF